jgi:hypothetical protein
MAQEPYFQARNLATLSQMVRWRQARSVHEKRTIQMPDIGTEPAKATFERHNVEICLGLN